LYLFFAGSSGSFDYSEDKFIAAFDAFLSKVAPGKPVALVVQGFVLSQYALLWAQQVGTALC
jgi:hypothetical protein